MRNRVFKPLIFLLVAAQLLLAVPAVAYVGATPCDEMEMAGTNGAEPCPCCPDGANSMKDCLTSCTLAALSVPETPVLERVAASALPVEFEPSTSFISLSDPPLKPPPIR